MVVSPDAGGAKRATAMADKLNMDFALFHRSRKRGKDLSGRSMTDSIGSLRTNGRDYKDEGAEDIREDENLELLVGSVEGKIAILVDDMIDTGETMRMASTSLIENGASQVWILVGHCAFARFCSYCCILLTDHVVDRSGDGLCQACLVTDRTSRGDEHHPNTRRTK